jgi:hypothetical protein
MRLTCKKEGGAEDGFSTAQSLAPLNFRGIPSRSEDSGLFLAAAYRAELPPDEELDRAR